MLSGEAINTNFNVLGLTRPGSNPQSTADEHMRVHESKNTM